MERSFPVLTDPVRAPGYGGPGLLDRALTAWCSSNLHDPRDQYCLRLTLRMIATMTAMMAALWVALRVAAVPWWAAAVPYLAVWGYLVPPVILMLHQTMHCPFFKDRRLNMAHPYVMSFFLGIPSGYREHHIGMHHVEDNMGQDLSSTIRYQRDSFLHFLHYFGRFFFLGMVEVPLYLRRKKRVAMARRLVAGELIQYAVVAAAVLVDWRFGVIAFLAPTVIIRFMMMAGNWGQHAFINTSIKNNGIANSITCINSGYNRRCFNDGYHIGHHLKANRHWTELPTDFEANRERYAREGAVVFEGLDFFLVSFLLWTGQWGVLARRYVRLDGAPRSDADVIAMLKERVRPVRSWPLENIG